MVRVGAAGGRWCEATPRSRRRGRGRGRGTPRASAARTAAPRSPTSSITTPATRTRSTAPGKCLVLQCWHRCKTMLHSARLSEKATFNFHTQESIKIENLKLKTQRQALRGSARDPALRRLRRAHLRGGVCARGAPPLARTALLLLVVRPAARRHQVRHNTRAANEISQNGKEKEMKH